MIDTRTMTVLELQPDTHSPITNVSHNVTLTHPTYQDYLLGKYILAKSFAVKFPKNEKVDIVEKYDATSLICFARNQHNKVDSMIRVCFDSHNALPVTSYIHTEYQQRKAAGQAVAETGRLFVDDDSEIYKYFMACVFAIARYMSVDCYLIQVREERKQYYEKLFGATLVDEDWHCPGCVHMAWEMERTPRLFNRRFPVDAFNFPPYLNGRAA